MLELKLELLCQKLLASQEKNFLNMLLNLKHSILIKIRLKMLLVVVEKSSTTLLKNVMKLRLILKTMEKLQSITLIRLQLKKQKELLKESLEKSKLAKNLRAKLLESKDMVLL